MWFCLFLYIFNFNFLIFHCVLLHLHGVVCIYFIKILFFLKNNKLREHGCDLQRISMLIITVSDRVSQHHATMPVR